MKIVFFELEKWEISYFRERIFNQHVEYYNTGIHETIQKAYMMPQYYPFYLSTLDQALWINSAF
jgi:hypothetical protein